MRVLCASPFSPCGTLLFVWTPLVVAGHVKPILTLGKLSPLPVSVSSERAVLLNVHASDRNRPLCVKAKRVLEIGRSVPFVGCQSRLVE